MFTYVRCASGDQARNRYNPSLLLPPPPLTYFNDAEILNLLLPRPSYNAFL